MSQVYSTEPQTTGRVILNTTHGPIDVHLFCKECPTTCRSFLQLCLDGYYDNIIFHRIISDFLIQIGEMGPTSSAGTGSSIKDFQEYQNRCKLPEIDVNRKKLEVIPRIKFNHRGQLAMALPLEGDDDAAASDEELASLSRQFFITMDEAPFLDKKYVIFGTVRGDTIFNALRIGKTLTVGESGEVADKENAPRIKDVRIVDNYFQDLVATREEFVPWKKVKETAKGEEDNLKKRRKKRKGKRDLNVLSFGGEMEDMDEGLDASFGMQSSHNKNGSNGSSAKAEKDSKKNGRTLKKKRKVSSITRSDQDQPDDDAIQIQSSVNHDNANTMESSANISKSTAKEIDYANVSETKDENGSTEVHRFKSRHEKKREKAYISAIKEIESKESTKAATPKMSAIEARRLKYLNKRNSATGGRKASKLRDEETMSKLDNFKSKMFAAKGFVEKGGKSQGTKASRDNSLAARMARKLEAKDHEESSTFENVPTYSGQVMDDKKDYGGSNTDWLKSKFKCKRHIDHDSKDQAMGGDGRKMDDYEVVDDKRRKSGGSSRNSRENSHRRDRDRPKW